MAKKKKRKVSSHSKGRIRERGENNNSRRIRTEAYYAWERGLKLNEVEGPLRGWLTYRSIRFRSVSRVYREKIYWFAPCGKTLITVYPVPERFLREDAGVPVEEENLDEVIS